jgi:hypothetical protein
MVHRMMQHSVSLSAHLQMSAGLVEMVAAVVGMSGSHYDMHSSWLGSNGGCGTKQGTCLGNT